MRGLFWALLFGGLIVTPVFAEDVADVARVQQFLIDRQCNPGAADGQWGGKSKRALAVYLGLTGLELARPFDAGSIDKLSQSQVMCTEAEDVLSPSPEEFRAADLMIGQEWRNHLETGARVGRVTLETDPVHVRSGKMALKLHLEPNDCGGDILPNGAPWNDCTSPLQYGAEYSNERVAVISVPSAKFGKDYWYGASLYLDGATFRKSPPAPPEHKAWHQVNLYQWIADQPMYDIVWFSNEPDKLSLKIRTEHCDPCEFQPLAENALDRWVDVVTHVKWSKKDDGFIVIWIDGKKAYDHTGPTLYPELNGPDLGQQVQLYRYSGVGQGWPALTAWFDQIIMTRDLTDLEPYFDITAEMKGPSS